MPSSLRVLQINLNHCRAAQDLLSQVTREKDIDLLVISEQYKDKEECDGWYPDTTGCAAVVTCSDSVSVEDIGEAGPGFRMITVRGIRLYSCYISPNVSLQRFEEFLKEVESSVRSGSGGAVIAGDFNAKSRSWGCPRTDARGALMELLISSLSLVVINEGATNTCRRGEGGSIVDLTLCTEGVASHTSDWQVLDTEVTLSDHAYITYVLEFRSSNRERPRNGGWSVRKLDQNIFDWVLGNLDFPSTGTESMVDTLVEQVQSVCDIVLPRRLAVRGRGPVYWWSEELAAIRRRCQAARRVFTRSRGRHVAEDVVESNLRDYRAAKKELRNAILKSKKQCWKDLCDAVEWDPFGRAYKIVSGKLKGHSPIPEIEKEGRIDAIIDGLFPSSSCELSVNISEDDSPGFGGEPFTIGELTGAIKSIRRGKAPGPDCLGNDVV